MTDQRSKSIMRCLGEFVGHVTKAVRPDRGDRDVREVRRDIDEQRRPDGIVLRRTTIEEVELPPSDGTHRNRSDRPAR